MENLAALAIPALLAVILVRTVLAPIKWTARLALHAGCGLVCLWLMNTASGFTGLVLPTNGVTVLLAGTLGLPGIALVLLLEIL